VEPHTRSGSGRREFGRVVLTSLVAGVRAELEERRARGQRLRARRSLHRLQELERALDRLERGLPALPPPWYARPGALGAASALWAATLCALIAAVVANGPSGLLVGAADVVMLVATLAWFCIAVARRGRREADGRRPPNGGSSTDDPCR
jgi:Flp pilus assembly protein TadB